MTAPGSLQRRKGPPPPRPKPADQPRGAAVDEPKHKIGWPRRIFGLVVFGALGWI